MSGMPTIASLYEDNREPLQLRWVAGTAGGQRRFRETASDAGVRTSDLVGHLNLIHPERIHVLGAPEVGFMARLEAARRTHYASDLMQARPLGLIVAEGLSAPAELIQIDRKSVV